MNSIQLLSGAGYSFAEASDSNIFFGDTGSNIFVTNSSDETIFQKSSKLQKSSFLVDIVQSTTTQIVYVPNEYGSNFPGIFSGHTNAKVYYFEEKKSDDGKKDYSSRHVVCRAESPITSICYSPKYIFVGSKEPNIRIYSFENKKEGENVKLWKPVKVLEKAHAGTLCMKINPQNTHLASIGYEGTLKIWNLETLECEQTFDNLFDASGREKCMEILKNQFISNGDDPFEDKTILPYNFSWSIDGRHILLPNFKQSKKFEISFLRITNKKKKDSSSIGWKRSIISLRTTVEETEDQIPYQITLSENNLYCMLITTKKCFIFSNFEEKFDEKMQQISVFSPSSMVTCAKFFTLIEHSLFFTTLNGELNAIPNFTENEKSSFKISHSKLCMLLQGMPIDENFTLSDDSDDEKEEEKPKIEKIDVVVEKPEEIVKQENKTPKKLKKKLRKLTKKKEDVEEEEEEEEDAVEMMEDLESKKSSKKFIETEAMEIDDEEAEESDDISSISTPLKPLDEQPNKKLKKQKLSPAAKGMMAALIGASPSSKTSKNLPKEEYHSKTQNLSPKYFKRRGSSSSIGSPAHIGSSQFSEGSQFFYPPVTQIGKSQPDPADISKVCLLACNELGLIQQKIIDKKNIITVEFSDANYNKMQFNFNVDDEVVEMAALSCSGVAFVIQDKRTETKHLKVKLFNSQNPTNTSFGFQKEVFTWTLSLEQQAQTAIQDHQGFEDDNLNEAVMRNSPIKAQALGLNKIPAMVNGLVFSKNYIFISTKLSEADVVHQFTASGIQIDTFIVDGKIFTMFASPFFNHLGLVSMPEQRLITNVNASALQKVKYKLSVMNCDNCGSNCKIIDNKNLPLSNIDLKWIGFLQATPGASKETFFPIDPSIIVTLDAENRIRIRNRDNDSWIPIFNFYNKLKTIDSSAKSAFIKSVTDRSVLFFPEYDNGIVKVFTPQSCDFEIPFLRNNINNTLNSIPGRTAQLNESLQKQTETGKLETSLFLERKKVFSLMRSLSELQNSSNSQQKDLQKEISKLQKKIDESKFTSDQISHKMMDVCVKNSDLDKIFDLIELCFKNPHAKISSTTLPSSFKTRITHRLKEIFDPLTQDNKKRQVFTQNSTSNVQIQQNLQNLPIFGTNDEKVKNLEKEKAEFEKEKQKIEKEKEKMRIEKEEKEKEEKERKEKEEKERKRKEKEEKERKQKEKERIEAENEIIQTEKAKKQKEIDDDEEKIAIVEEIEEEKKPKKGKKGKKEEIEEEKNEIEEEKKEKKGKKGKKEEIEEEKKEIEEEKQEKKGKKENKEEIEEEKEEKKDKKMKSPKKVEIAEEKKEIEDEIEEIAEGKKEEVEEEEKKEEIEEEKKEKKDKKKKSPQKKIVIEDDDEDAFEDVDLSAKSKKSSKISNSPISSSKIAEKLQTPQKTKKSKDKETEKKDKKKEKKRKREEEENAEEEEEEDEENKKKSKKNNSKKRKTDEDSQTPSPTKKKSSSTKKKEQEPAQTNKLTNYFMKNKKSEE